MFFAIFQTRKALNSVFWICLLVALLTDWSRFCLMALVGLIVGLTISGAELMSAKVLVSFLRWFSWNNLISFLRCYIAKAGSQILSSLSSLSNSPDNKNLVDNLIPIYLHRLRSLGLLLSCIPCYCCHWYPIPVFFHPLVPS